LNISTPKASVRIPLLTGVILLALVSVMWAYLDQNRESNLRKLVKLEAESRLSEINGDMRARLPALQRMVDRWILRGGIPKDEFIADIIAGYLQFRPKKEINIETP